MALPAWFETLGSFSRFAVRALLVAPHALARPQRLAAQLYHILLGALPLATVTGLAMGVVIWLHLHRMLLRFGTGNTTLLPQALALAVVLEFAPIAAGLLVAGRSGAGLGAELGSMRLTEQIDALEVLGESPWLHLVAPRVLACVLALPMLTMMIAYTAFVGSFAAEVLGGNLTWTQYRNAWMRSLELRDVLPTLLKTAVFGCLIGTTGCYVGLGASGGTEGVGRAATRGVVIAMLLVVLADLVLVRLFQLVG